MVDKLSSFRGWNEERISIVMESEYKPLVQKGAPIKQVVCCTVIDIGRKMSQSLRYNGKRLDLFSSTGPSKEPLPRKE